MKRLWTLLSLLLMLSMAVLPAMAQEEEALPLTETYSSADGSFTFAYPTEWVAQSGQNSVVVADSAATLNTPPADFAAGQVQMLLLPGNAALFEEQLGVEDGSVLPNVVDTIAATRAGDIPAAEVTLFGEYPGAYTAWTAEGQNSALLAMVNVGDGVIILITAVTAEGELDALQPTLFAIIESFDFRTVEELAALDAERQAEWANSLFQLPDEPNTPYYVITPEGEAPEEGWPVLVAIHGAGGTGFGIVQRFADMANEQGAILVAPTFEGGDYEQLVSDMRAILEIVNDRYPVDARGPVLYGFSAGASFVTRFAAQYPDAVAGVVAEGAPTIHTPTGEDPSVAYVIIYGENDSFRSGANEVVAGVLLEFGYRVRYETVPNAGHVMTQEGIDLTAELLSILYSEEAE